MSILVGYGQNIKYLNKKPDLKTEIYDLSAVVESRYNTSKEKISSVEEFMKYPIKYCFNVSAKSKTETTAFKHCYYFDNKEEAVSEHKKLKVKLYDQLTAPFLKKLDSKQSLSINDQMRLHAIFNRMDKLR